MASSLNLFNSSEKYSLLRTKITQGISRTISIASTHKVPTSNGVIAVLTNLDLFFQNNTSLDQLPCYSNLEELFTKVIPSLPPSETPMLRVKSFAHSTADYIEARSKLRFNRSPEKVVDIFLLNPDIVVGSPEALWLEAATAGLYAYQVILGL